MADISPADLARLEEGQLVQLAELVAPWRDKYPDVKVKSVVAQGTAAQALLDHGRHAQLLVVGTRGRGGFKAMLLGSTSHSLITHAVCPVVVVRPD